MERVSRKDWQLRPTPTIATRSMRLVKPAGISLAYFGAMFDAKLQVSNAVAVFFKEEEVEYGLGLRQGSSVMTET